MFRTLRSRLLLTYLLVTVLVLTLIGASLIFFLVNNPILVQISYTRLDLTASRLVHLNNDLLQKATELPLQATLERLDERFRIRILVLSSDRKVLADSRPESGIQDPLALTTDAEVDQAFRGEFQDLSGATWLWLGAPLDRSRTVVVATRKLGLWALREFASDVLTPVLQAAALGFVVSLILAWLISRWVAAPLDRMANAASAVAEGNFRNTEIPDGPREVQELAIAFNEMVTQVQTSQQIQKEFLANVSHELKTPLTSIQGFAQAMLDGTVEDSESRDHAAKVIYEETDRLGRLVEDLLDLARLDAGQIEFDRHPVDLSILLQSIVDRMSLSAAEKSVQLERHLDGLAPMIGDGDRLAQVFTNLLDNAIKHTPEGGTVRLHGETEAGWISIHVDDSGRGIPNEDLSHIFERFYQVDKARRGGKGRGVGLGLAISRQIVEAHGGR
ncbi:MAG: HAMP domain-containing sensor histidine kinase, partial [Anaerolineales bacterium]